jgi:hypothetical protein
MIDFTADEVYFDEMWMPLDDYLGLVKDTKTLVELRVGLAGWKRLQETDRAAA